MPLPSSTVLLFAATAAVLGLMSLFYAVLAVVFLRRAVLTVQRTESGFVLHGAAGAQAVPAASVRLIRHLGSQFSSDETKPAYVLFLANRRLWICPSGDSQVWARSSFNSMANSAMERTCLRPAAHVKRWASQT